MEDEGKKVKMNVQVAQKKGTHTRSRSTFPLTALRSLQPKQPAYDPRSARLAQEVLKQLYAQRVFEPINVDESKHNLYEDERDRESRQPTPLPVIGVGKKAVAGFYKQYKEMPKSWSSDKRKSKSPIYHYLRKVDKYNELPRPMGLVKWQGSSNELNVQYLPRLYNVVRIRWGMCMRRR